MDALVGGRSAGIRYIGKAALLASVSGAALGIACWLPSVAWAETYSTNSWAELQGYMTFANGDGDPSSTIQLTASFVTAGALPVPTKPITIDTQGFTLFGPANSGVQIIGAGADRTLVGTFMGSIGGTSGAALLMRNGASVTNMGLVQGATNATGNGGPGVDFGGPGAGVTLTNSGIIRGGTGTTGGYGVLVRTSSTGSNFIVNTGTGTIEGGSGSAAIMPNNTTTNLNIVNSGSIRAGAGQTDAIRLAAGSTGLIDLTLEAGSVIEGNVVAGAGADDVLRLGGSADASFDVSAIGPSAQYRNFNAFIKTGTSTWTLTGTGASAIPLSVQQGTLLVTGSTLGPVGVLTGATLGGTGTIAGDVTIDTNGTLAPGAAGAAPGTLRINGNLTLNNGALLAYNFGQAGVPGGAFNDLTNVTGNLTLDGTLNVTTAPGGTFDPGLYRIFNYSGTLTNNGLTVGSVPTPDFTLQTAVPGQVNLVNTAGLTLRFWDGATDPRDNSVIGGGNGTWLAASGNNNWTNELGVPNGGFAAGSFAVFTGAAGTVAVDSVGPVIVSGMQFATSG